MSLRPSRSATMSFSGVSSVLLSLCVRHRPLTIRQVQQLRGRREHLRRELRGPALGLALGRGAPEDGLLLLRLRRALF